MADQPHHRLLEETLGEIQCDYMRLHDVAQEDPQRAGHGGEGTWADLLRKWLPSQYEVATRRYIVPELGDDCFEMDVVIFSPGCPPALRAKEEVMAGTVAAAFAVTLTLDAGGISDGIGKAAALARAMMPRYGTPRSQLLRPYPVGLLAHSHVWKHEASKPRENIADALEVAQLAAAHPRELLDYTCVADFGTWRTMRIPYLPPSAMVHPGASESQMARGVAETAVLGVTSASSANPVGVFISALYERLSYLDEHHGFRGRICALLGS